MMADAAARAGVERAQRRRQAQMQQPTTMMTNNMMKAAAPAMLKAQLDMEVPEFSWVRYWSLERSG